jgi:hypothetical protein
MAAAANIRVLIAGAERNGAGLSTVKVLRGVSVQQRLGARASAEFILDARDDSWRPQRGMVVQILENPGGLKVFAGLIQSTVLNVVSGVRRFRVSCVDYSVLADRRLAGERTFTNEFASNIVREVSNTGDIVIDFVPGNSGPIIKELKLDYPTVAAALDEVSRLAGPGWNWWIDADRRLHFGDLDAAAATYTIAEDEFRVLKGSVDLEESSLARANKVVVRLGRTETAEQVETFNAGSGQPPDGSRKEWTLAYPISQAPTVAVNGVQESVGIRGESTADRWLYEQGSALLTQNPVAIAPATGAAIVVTYVGLTVTTAFVQDDADIAATAAAEGTAGVYELLVDVNRVISASEAEAVAQAVLAEKKQPGFSLRLTASGQNYPDFRPVPGDVIRLNRPGYGDKTFVVRSVALVEIGKSEGTFFRRTVEATTGTQPLDGVAFFSGAVSGAASASSGAIAAGSRPAFLAVAAASVITIDAAAAVTQKITIDRAITFEAPVNTAAGLQLTLLLAMHATTPGVPTFDAAWNLNAEQIDAGAGRLTRIDFVFDDAGKAWPTWPMGAAA